ncbi:hypothetical protein [Pantoea ananatis]|uniref:hypothetical protein n=1 Tax=Pantoea ananas TaxID=553 RepID=UPI0011C06443|nr:hypothetical protein [Pantoea ananatis]
MKIDNAAERLHNFFQNTRSAAERNEATRSVLRNYLNLKENAQDHELYMGISGLLQLPMIIQNEIDENFPNSKLTHWHLKVRSSFNLLSLNAPWRDVLGPIDERTITELSTLSLLFSTKGEIEVIGQDDIIEFIEKVNELKNDTLSSSLPSGMKSSILKYLNKILSALETYHITGAEPIMEAMESMVGRTVLNKAYGEALAETGIGKKVGDMISLLANTITVAQGIPFIATPLLTLLTNKV